MATVVTGNKYPYWAFDRLTAAELNSAFELSPGVTPPAHPNVGLDLGAGQFKYWVDTTDALHPALRQCISPNSTAGIYVPTEWITIGTYDIAESRFFINGDQVGFTGTIAAPGLISVGDAVIGGNLNVAGSTSVQNLNVNGGISTVGGVSVGNGLTTTGGTIEASGPTAALSFTDRLLGAGESWSWVASNDIAYLTAVHNTVGRTLLTIDLATGYLLSTGGVTAPEYLLGGVAFAGRGGNAHIVYDYDGQAAISLYGAAGGNHNYYTGDVHTFQNNAGTRIFEINSNGDVSIVGIVTVPTTLGVGVLNVAYDAAVGGNLVVTAGLSVGASAAVNGALNVIGNIQTAGGQVTGAYLGSSGNINAAGDIAAAGNIASLAQVTGAFVGSTGAINAATTMNAVQYNIRGQTVIYDDPGGTQVLFCGPGGGINYNFAINNDGTTFFRGTSHTFQNDLTGIVPAIFNAAGTYNASGSWMVISDDHLKENIQPYTAGLAELMQFNPMSFTYKAPATFAVDEDDEPVVRYGLMASEVEPVLPEMVAYVDVEGGSNPVATLAPSHLLYVLLNAVKELNAKVDTLLNPTTRGEVHD